MLTTSRSSVAGLLAALVVFLYPFVPGRAVATQAPVVDRSLPDLGVFLERVRAKLVNPETVLNSHEYRTRVTSVDRGDDEIEKKVELYDVRPAGGRPHHVLIEKNGRRLPAAEPDRLEAEHRKVREERLARRARETEANRRKRAEREAERKREEAAMVADAFRLYDFQFSGRDTVDGHPVLVVAFTGKPGPAETDVGRMIPKTAGKAWIAEDDHEIVRIEFETLRTVTYGWSILARVRTGAKLVFERQRSSDGTWLPSRYHLTGRVRLMLIKPMNVDRLVEYYDFRRPKPEAAGTAHASRTSSTSD